MNEGPKHIAFIFDGNRRWARAKGMPPWEGHRVGFKKVEDLLKWSRDLGVKEISMYCFSIQNFERPPEEVKFLMDMFEKVAKDSLKNKEIHKNEVRVRFIGRFDMLPERVQKPAKELMDATKNYNNYFVNFCMAYGGREEIVDGINKAIRDAKEGKINDVNEKNFKDYLQLKDEPEIVIRTSGEHRISNFLPWQTIYSELFFLDKHWPDFSKEDLVNVIDEFKEKRNRRFGK
jgi:tritrans,polycis-undecaprenyl-diphosphate synthase [geranylgeranyl-diphosphate specific]